LFQVPLVAVRVELTLRVPETMGEVALTGAEAAAAMVAVTALLALALPLVLVAVTTERTVEPASADTSVYPEEVAPDISAQEAPEVLQRCHL
jgi:hypothetical protein